VDTPDRAVVGHYESVREEERIASGLGELELLRAQEVLRRHLPAAPADVLDVGGATGVHAAWLAADGYRVRIVDITPRHVEEANATLGSRGVVAELGDARSLGLFDDSVDVVLLFGPLYHLTERADRVKAIAEACRVVRPGGLVALAAISRFASLFDGLGRGFVFDHDFLQIVRADLESGQHRNPEQREHWFTTAFFHHPDELHDEASEAGLQIVEQVGLEGLAGYLPHLAEHWDDPSSREVIRWAARAVESEPSLAGLSAHMLLVGRSPG
jgi:SAM-dependent methyltransferase